MSILAGLTHDQLSPEQFHPILPDMWEETMVETFMALLAHRGFPNLIQGRGLLPGPNKAQEITTPTTLTGGQGPVQRRLWGVNPLLTAGHQG